MIFLLAFLALADTPDPVARDKECRSRTPGLHCFQPKPSSAGVTCQAICAFGKVQTDGGTEHRRNVYEDAPQRDEAACRARLEEKCK